MPTAPKDLMAEIREKIRVLASERDTALARITKLEERIYDLETNLDDTQTELHKARLDVEFLTVSHKLADSPEALVAARKTIASLIRKVDSAISLVKNDPADS